MDDATTGLTEDLLAQAAWARGLARRLVAGEARSDDVLQQAWLAALKRRRDAIRTSARGWFGGVLRHVAAKQRRERVRRDARERAAALPEAQPATADHVAELEAQRLVVDALLRIEEPYRETLVRRWYRDEKPAAIARAMGVPVKTADTRLARGLERLRAELTALRGGVARDGLLALLPLAASAPGPWVVFGSLAGGGLAVGSTFKYAAAAVLIAAAAWWTLRDDGAAKDARAPGGGASVATSAESAPAATESAPALRAKDEEAGAAAAAASSLVVRVTDDAGGAVESALVTLFVGETLLRQERLFDGLVRLPRPESDARLLVEPSGWRPKGSGPACVAVPAHARELAVALPRGAVLSGRLVCDGGPLGCGVELTFKPGEPFRALRDVPPKILTQLGSFAAAAHALSDTDGGFEFTGLDDGPGWFCIDHEFSTQPIRRTSEGAYHKVDAIRFERPVAGTTVEIYSPPAVVGRLVQRSGAPGTPRQIRATFDGGRRVNDSTGRFGDGGRFRVHLPFEGARSVDLQIAGETDAESALLHLDGPFLGTRDVGDVVLAESRTLRVRIVGEGGATPALDEVLLVGPRGARRRTRWSSRDFELDVPSLFTQARFVARGWLSSTLELPAASNDVPIEVVLERATRLTVRTERVGPPEPAALPPQVRIEIATRSRLLEPSLDDPEIAAVVHGQSLNLDRDVEPGWTVAAFLGNGEGGMLTGVVSGVPLRLRAMSGTSRILAEQTVVLARGEVREVVLQYDAALVRFAARVVDASGAPIPDASVCVRPCRENVRYCGIGTVTDADGRAQMDEYFDDVSAVEIVADGFVPWLRSPVRIGGADVLEFRLERCWPLAVEVVDSEGRRVDPELVDAVALAALGSPAPPRFGSDRTDDGAHVLLKMPACPVRVRAQVGGRDYFADVAPPAPRERIVVPLHGQVELRYTLPLPERAALGELLGAITLAPRDDHGAAVTENTVLFAPQRPTGGVSFTTVLPGRYEAVLIWRDENGDELRREPTGIEFEVTANAKSDVVIER